MAPCQVLLKDQGESCKIIRETVSISHRVQESISFGHASRVALNDPSQLSGRAIREPDRFVHEAIMMGRSLWSL